MQSPEPPVKKSAGQKVPKEVVASAESAPDPTPQRLEDLFYASPPGVIETVAEDDEMYAGNLAHYIQVGESALRCVRTALFAAGRGAPSSILDMPSGHGRVLRVFKAAWPEAQLSACDILPKGVAFCAETFGAKGIVAELRPDLSPLEDRYDLIWCGSLLTHFCEADWEALFRLFSSSLRPGGVAVATVQGRRSVDKIRNGDFLGLEEDQARALLEDYYAHGFAYCDYEYRPGYGISLSSGSWTAAFVERFPELRLVTYIERGWDAHQDVVAVQRVDPLVHAQHEQILAEQSALRAGLEAEATEERESVLRRNEELENVLRELRSHCEQQADVIADLERDLEGHRATLAEVRRVSDERSAALEVVGRELRQDLRGHEAALEEMRRVEREREASIEAIERELHEAHRTLGELNERVRVLTAETRSRWRSLIRAFGPKPV